MTPRTAFVTLAFALAIAAPATAASSSIQADRYFAVQPVGAAAPEFVVRVSETARAKAFAQALRHGQPMRLTTRIVQRAAPWNAAWPFYSERHRLISIDTLVSRCSSHAPFQVAALIGEGAKVHGSAWCPAVRVVREIRPQDNE